MIRAGNRTALDRTAGQRLSTLCHVAHFRFIVAHRRLP